MTRHYLDILADVIRENWDKPALTDYATLDNGPGNSYTYGQMYEQILALCDRFRQLGIKPGDHIAICGANSANWIISYLAIAKYMGVSVLIMNTLPPEQICQMISFADTKALLADIDILDELSLEMLECDVLSLENFEVKTGYELVKSHYKELDISFPKFNADSLFEICFTSGSTNTPKGVMLPYRSINNNVKNGIDVLPKEINRTYLAVLPFAHVYGLLGGFLAHSAGGHHVYILSSLAPSVLTEALCRVRPYSFVTVPAIIERMFSSLGNRIVDVLGTSVKEILVGGAAMNPVVEEKLIAMGLPLMIGCGSTETGALQSATWWTDYRVHSCGRILSGNECKIAPNGEILVRGENVMLGYYKDPEATAAKIDKDGWLHTGDRGHLDEHGYLYVEGRLEQDMIVLPSGENISPVKVESIINACDGVEESIVIARDGKLMALVVMEDVSRFPERSGFRELSEQELRNLLLAQINPQLPAYSQLFGIEFLTTPLARTEKKTIKRYLYK